MELTFVWIKINKKSIRSSQTNLDLTDLSVKKLRGYIIEMEKKLGMRFYKMTCVSKGYKMRREQFFGTGQ